MRKKLVKYIVARMWRLYKTGIGLTTGFIVSHTVTQLQCIHFTTHYCSCNSSLKTAAQPEYSLVTGTVHVTNSTLSTSEDSGPNSATAAATNSYGVPCHHSLTGAAPLSNTHCLTGFVAELYSPWTDHRKRLLRFLYCCMGCPLLCVYSSVA
jgi:hypothetical protein